MAFDSGSIPAPPLPTAAPTPSAAQPASPVQPLTATAPMSQQYDDDDNAAPTPEALPRTKNADSAPSAQPSTIDGILGAVVQRSNEIANDVAAAGQSVWRGSLKALSSTQDATTAAISGVSHYVSEQAQAMQDFLKGNILKPGDVIIWTGGTQHITTYGTDGKFHCETTDANLTDWRRNSSAGATDHFVIMRPPAGADVGGMINALERHDAGGHNEKCAHWFQTYGRQFGFLPTNFAQPENARQYPRALASLHYTTVAEFKGGHLVAGSTEAVHAAAALPASGAVSTPRTSSLQHIASRGHHRGPHGSEPA